MIKNMGGLTEAEIKKREKEFARERQGKGKVPASSVPALPPAFSKEDWEKIAAAQENGSVIVFRTDSCFEGNDITPPVPDALLPQEIIPVAQTPKITHDWLDDLTVTRTTIPQFGNPLPSKKRQTA